MTAIMTPVLTQDFENAAQMCRKETKALSEHFRQSLLRSTVPYWNPALWPQSAPYNCYNFAANNKTADLAFPGMFSTNPVKTPRYYFNTCIMHADVHEGALRDGLIYLGERFFEAARGRDVTPVALFMREPAYIDFHWMALRRRGRDLFWAHIPGKHAAATRLYQDDCIFDTVAKRGYSLFGGYYGVPTRFTAQEPL